VTDPQELADAIAAAADDDRRTFDDAYAEFDHGPVCDRYVDCFRTAVDDHGWL
jgi:hypothetical protein